MFKNLKNTLRSELQVRHASLKRDFHSKYNSATRAANIHSLGTRVTLLKQAVDKRRLDRLLADDPPLPSSTQSCCERSILYYVSYLEPDGIMDQLQALEALFGEIYKDQPKSGEYFSQFNAFLNSKFDWSALLSGAELPVNLQRVWAIAALTRITQLLTQLAVTVEQHIAPLIPQPDKARSDGGADSPDKSVNDWIYGGLVDSEGKANEQKIQEIAQNAATAQPNWSDSLDQYRWCSAALLRYIDSLGDSPGDGEDRWLTKRKDKDSTDHESTKADIRTLICDQIRSELLPAQLAMEFHLAFPSADSEFNVLTWIGAALASARRLVHLFESWNSAQESAAELRQSCEQLRQLISRIDASPAVLQSVSSAFPVASDLLAHFKSLSSVSLSSAPEAIRNYYSLFSMFLAVNFGYDNLISQFKAERQREGVTVRSVPMSPEFAIKFGYYHPAEAEETQDSAQQFDPLIVGSEEFSSLVSRLRKFVDQLSVLPESAKPSQDAALIRSLSQALRSLLDFTSDWDHSKPASADAPWAPLYQRLFFQRSLYLSLASFWPLFHRALHCHFMIVHEAEQRAADNPDRIIVNEIKKLQETQQAGLGLMQQSIAVQAATQAQIAQFRDESVALAHQTIDAVMNAKENELPACVLILPHQPQGSGITKWMRNYDSLIYEKSNLHLLCEFNCCAEGGKVKPLWHRTGHTGFEIKKPKEFVKQAAPIIAGSLTVLSLAARLANVIGIDIREEVTGGLEKVREFMKQAELLCGEAANDLIDSSTQLPKRLTGTGLEMLKSIIVIQQADQQPGLQGTSIKALGGLRQVGVRRDGPAGKHGTWFWLCEQHATLVEDWNEQRVMDETAFRSRVEEIEDKQPKTQSQIQEKNENEEKQQKTPGNNQPNSNKNLESSGTTNANPTGSSAKTNSPAPAPVPVPVPVVPSSSVPTPSSPSSSSPPRPIPDDSESDEVASGGLCCASKPNRRSAKIAPALA